MSYIVLSLMLLCSAFVVCGAAEKKQPLLTKDQLVKELGMQQQLSGSDEEDATITNEQLLHIFQIDLNLKNVDRVGGYIVHAPIPLDQKITLLKTIVTDAAYGFTQEEIAQLILAVANGAEQSEQDRFFDMLLTFPGLIDTVPILFIAAEHQYTDALRSFMNWSSRVIASKPELKKALNDSKYRSLIYATQESDVSALKLLASVKDFISKQDATALLWQIVHTGKGIHALAEVIKLGANIDVIYQGKTPLIQAIQRKDFAMVQALINAGANVNALGDLEIGSPLQQAIEVRDRTIERLLRRSGAHE